MDTMKLARQGGLHRGTRGSNLVEYILLVGLVAVVALVGFKKFGGSVNHKALGQATTVAAIP